MLRSVQDFEGFAIQARDGRIGEVTDFYFDDESWTVRYLVVDTGTWLSSRSVLVSPNGLGRANWLEQTLPMAATREQVSNSPDIDLHKSVSRQHEMAYMGYYGYPYYWGGGGLWGEEAYPGLFGAEGGLVTERPYAVSSESEAAYRRSSVIRHRADDPHLRSFAAVKGYHLHASDGEIGHLQGLLVDEESWAIRYLVIDTSNWWMGQKVLIAPQWVSEVSWADAKLYVTLSRKSIKTAPRYDPDRQLDWEDEVGLHAHYRRPGYWGRALHEPESVHFD